MTEKEKSSGFLKGIFEWMTDVIQSADTSIVVFVLVVLPFIVPLVPAWITANNLYNQMGFPHPIDYLGGITVELLGFAGAVLVLKSVTEWANSKNQKSFWEVFINFMAYAFYLVAVISINVILDKEAGKDSSYVWVIGLFCLLSVPSGMLSASRIVTKEKISEMAAAEDKLSQRELEKETRRRNERLEKYRIKYGRSPSSEKQVVTETQQVRTQRRNASDFKNEMAKALSDEYSKTGKVLKVIDLVKMFDLEYDKAKGYISSLRKAWAEHFTIDKTLL